MVLLLGLVVAGHHKKRCTYPVESEAQELTEDEMWVRSFTRTKKCKSLILLRYWIFAAEAVSPSWNREAETVNASLTRRIGNTVMPIKSRSLWHQRKNGGATLKLGEVRICQLSAAFWLTEVVSFYCTPTFTALFSKTWETYCSSSYNPEMSPRDWYGRWIDKTVRPSALKWE